MGSSHSLGKASVHLARFEVLDEKINEEIPSFDVGSTSGGEDLPIGLQSVSRDELYVEMAGEMNRRTFVHACRVSRGMPNSSLRV